MKRRRLRRGLLGRGLTDEACFKTSSCKWSLHRFQIAKMQEKSMKLILRNSN